MDGVAEKIIGQLYGFSHTAAVCIMPEGEYEAVACEAQHVLGTSGMPHRWLFVRITDAPEGAEDWIGREINIRVGDN